MTKKSPSPECKENQRTIVALSFSCASVNSVLGSGGGVIVSTRILLLLDFMMTCFRSAVFFGRGAERKAGPCKFTMVRQ